MFSRLSPFYTNMPYSRNESTRKAPQELPVTLSVWSSWSNTTFAENLCSILTSSTTFVIISGSGADYPPFRLPDCFWAISSTITQFEATVPLLISGSTLSGVQSDPLLRFSTSLVSLKADFATFVDPVSENGISNGRKFTPNWASFFASRPLLSTLRIRHSNLIGPLPNSFPAQLSEADLSYNGFTGTIPATLLDISAVSELKVSLASNKLIGSISSMLLKNLRSEISSLSLDFSSNALSGSISSALFKGSTTIINLSSLQLSVQQNKLIGTIPSDLLVSFSKLNALTLNLGDNQLIGSILPSFFRTITSSNLSSIDFSAGGNRISGAVPAFFEHLSNVPSITTAHFNFSSNQLTGSLPPSLVPATATFHHANAVSWILNRNAIAGTLPISLFTANGGSNLSAITVDLAYNQLTGGLPADLLLGAGTSSGAYANILLNNNRFRGSLPSFNIDSIQQLRLDLSSNSEIGGSLPSNFLSALHSDRFNRTLIINFNNCGLTGSIPQALLGGTNSAFNFNFDNNKLTGTYPWYDVIYKASALNSLSYILSAANNQLSGTIDLPPLSENSPFTVSLNLYNNKITRIYSSVGYLRELNVGLNPDMEGELPSYFFNNAAKMTLFVANRTRLSGTFPPLSGTITNEIRVLDLSFTKVNFCTSDQRWWNSSRLQTCQLQGTNATQCRQFYPPVCRYDGYSAPAVGSSDEPSSSATPVVFSLCTVLLASTFAIFAFMS